MGLRAYARQLPVQPRVVTLGVSLDWEPESGLQALRALGSFDEFSLGQNWLNSQAVRFGFREHKEVVATPSAFLVRRVITPRTQTISVSPDSIVERAVGVSNMMALSKRLLSKRGAYVAMSDPKSLSLRGPR